MKIYWTSFVEYDLPDFTLAVDQPTKLLHNIEGDIKNTLYPRCGAFNEHQKNTFVVRSPLEYSLKIFPKEERWESPDSQHVENWIVLQDFNNRCVQLKTGILLFSETSVNVTVSHPFLHHTDYTRHGNILPGTFNISKWIRPIQAAYYFQPASEYSFKVTNDTPLAYISFDTKEKVALEFFQPTETIHRVVQQCLMLKHTRARHFSLKEAYSKFEQHRGKRMILNEIKKQKRFG